MTQTGHEHDTSMTLEEAIKDIRALFERDKKHAWLTDEYIAALSLVLLAAEKYKNTWSCEGCAAVGKQYMKDPEYMCDICSRERGAEHETDHYQGGKKK